MEQPGPDVVFERGTRRVGREAMRRQVGNHAVAIELELVGVHTLRCFPGAIARSRERSARQRQCNGKEHRGFHRPLPVRLAQLDDVVMTPSFGSPWVTRSEEHTSALHSIMRLSYALFCLKKKNTPT